MTQLNTAAQNSQADNAASDLATAPLTFYSGTPPGTANDPLSGNNVLVEHTFAGFLASANGSAVANAIADETITGAGTQTVTFARTTLAGVTYQLSVGLSGADIIVSSTDYVNGGTSKINAINIFQPPAAS